MRPRMWSACSSMIRTHLAWVEARRGAQHRGRRALDGGPRRPQLVAHHAQELGPLPLELLEWGQVLHRDDHRLDLAADVCAPVA